MHWYDRGYGSYAKGRASLRNIKLMLSHSYGTMQNIDSRSFLYLLVLNNRITHAHWRCGRYGFEQTNFYWLLC